MNFSNNNNNKLKKKKRYKKIKLSTSQFKEGGSGACVTIALYMVKYFCSEIGWNLPIDCLKIEEKLITACKHWKLYINEFQSAREGIDSNPQLDLEIIKEKFHRPKNPIINVNIYNELVSYPTEHKHPICAILLNSDYFTYFFMYRNSKEYILIDSHGTNATICIFRRPSSLINYLRRKLNFSEKNSFEISWIQPRKK